MGTVLRIGLFVFILGLYCFDVHGQSTCKDEKHWCGSQKHFCGKLPVMDRTCRKTCGLCVGNTAACPAAGCQQHCRVGKNQVTCECFQGYTLNNDGKTCSDINECDTPGICRLPESPVCTNTEGSYSCGGCLTKPNHINYYKSFVCCARTPLSGCGQNKATGVPGASGPDVILGMWPWTVLLLIDGTYCTGVLISDEWVLTAAHCFAKLTFTTTNVEAFVGIRTTNVNESNPYSRRININRIEVHNNYHFPYNDIALVHLESKVENSYAIRPICLPNGEVPRRSDKCFMSGFEAVFNDVEVHEEMNSAEVTVTPADDCKRKFGNLGKNIDSDNSICGKFNFPTQPVCPGETGGPIVCQRCDSCDWYVAGLMTFGDMCLKGNKEHAVYVSVESYENWISNVTKLTVTKTGTCSLFATGWRPWSSWTACTKTCGSGSRLRHRECAHGSPGHPGCLGKSVETSSCNSNKCPAWGRFSKWSSCSVTCGVGTRSRTRACMDGYVGQIGCDVGGTDEIETCEVNGCSHWSGWSPFSECSETCGNSGYRSSTRDCIVYAGSSNNNDDDDDDSYFPNLTCDGEDTVIEPCTFTNPCPSWSEWSSWSECDVSCGGNGIRTSSRSCLNGNDCKGEKTQTQICSSPSCPDQLTKWSTWSECSATCGAGTQTRQRSCLNLNCNNNSQKYETKTCEMGACASNRYIYSDWSSCSESCGQGVRTRKLICTTDDRSCSSKEEAELCSAGACAQWSQWSQLSDCDVTCGNGSRSRTRTCTGAGKCKGEATEVVPCINPTCCEDDPNYSVLCEHADGFCQYDIISTRCRKSCKLC